jgi:hypothetical protein
MSTMGEGVDRSIGSMLSERFQARHVRGEKESGGDASKNRRLLGSPMRAGNNITVDISASR